MVDNWYEIMEMGKMRDEAIRNDVHKIRMSQKKKEGHVGLSGTGNMILGYLGKAFSTVGDTLQSHYQHDFETDKKQVKKVS